VSWLASLGAAALVAWRGAQAVREAHARRDEPLPLPPPEPNEPAVKPTRPPAYVRRDEDGRVRAGEAGEIANVDTARDEQRLVEQSSEALDAAHRLLARNSIAVR